MRTHFKKLSKSALAVVLSVCMLISCCMVGLIATDAARIGDDAAVGWNSTADRLHIKIGSEGWTDIYFSTGGEAKFTVPSDGTTIEFELNFNGTVFKLDSSQSGFAAGDIRSTTGTTRLAKKNASSTYVITGVYADDYTLQLGEMNSAGTEVNITLHGTGSGGTTVDVSTGDWYLYGHQFGSNDWDVSKGKTAFDGYDSEGGYVYKVHTVCEPNDYFRIYNSKSETHYRPAGEELMTLDDTDGKQVATGITSAFGLYSSGNTPSGIAPGTEVKICFDGAKVWVVTNKEQVAGSLALVASKLTATAVNESFTLTATAADLQTDAGNLVYKLYQSDGTLLATSAATAAASYTFPAQTSNARYLSYYATVEQATGSDYRIVQSGTVTVTNTNDAYKPTYTVTYSAGENGTVQAYDENGDPLSSGSSVKEGKHVTLKATPASNSYRFKNWTGDGATLLTSEEKSKSAVTITVYQNISLTGTFEEKGYKIYYQENAWGDMAELSNGWFISKHPQGNPTHFTVYRNSDGKYVHVSNSDGYYGFKDNWFGPDDVSGKWKSGVPSGDKNYYQITNSTNVYIVYDPATDRVWTSYESDGQYGVTVIAKDGTVRDEFDTTALYGNTTITVLSNPAGGTLNVVDDQVYQSKAQKDKSEAATAKAQKVELTSAQARAGVKLKIRTELYSTYSGNYFVKGFDINGGETQAIIHQEFNDDGTEKASYTDKAKIDGGYNEFTIDVQGYENSVIEITPIYYKKEATKGDNIRFIVDGFSGEVKDIWGGNIACYPYQKDGSEVTNEPYFMYPGQPMVCTGGRYEIEIPRAEVSAMTLNNYVWDYTHADRTLGGHTEEAIKAANRQTYDYDEFTVINSIFEDIASKNNNVWPDEDIIFSFKYKPTKDITASNLGTAVYYINSDTSQTGYSYDYDYRKNYSTIDPDDYSGWENLTNFYGERVDLLGNLVDVTDNDRKNVNPIRVISNGYDNSRVGMYATAWAIYQPQNWVGDPGTYSLVEVIGSQGKNDSYRSESYLIDYPNVTNLMNKYGDDTSDSSFVTTLYKYPVQICYEDEVRYGQSNERYIQNWGDEGEVGYRSDGRWYYSNSTQMVKAHALIEYRESTLDTYTRDYFQPDNIDYMQSGYDKSKNTGLSTGIRAYFTNSGIVSNASSSYTNTVGSTEAAAITDGEQTFNLVTSPDLDGMYTFEGWYLLDNGKYTFISSDYEYEGEAMTNDVFVARYVKVPSGIVNITHSLTDDSEGTATTSLQVSVVSASNTDSTVFAFEETTGGQIVNAAYIKKDTSSPKALKITLKTKLGAFTGFDSFKEKIAGTLRELEQQGVMTSVSIDTSDASQAIATIIIPINDLFNASGDQTTKALPFFSKVIQYSYSYEVKYTYNSRYWGEQFYIAKGVFAIEELATYVDSSTMSFKSGQKAVFLASKSPYEDNFKETVEWNFDGADDPAYDAVNRKYTGTVAAVQTANKSIDIKFVFPFEYNNATIKTTNPDTNQPYGLVPVQSSEDGNRIMKVSTDSTVAFTDTLTYLDWYSLNDCKNADDKKDNTKANEPFLLEAPNKIYEKGEVVDGQQTYTEWTFQYWSLSTFPTDGSNSVEYKRGYSRFFNLALYQSTVATPVYQVVDEQHQQVKPATGNNATITFLENSRNQWNWGGGNEVSKVKDSWVDHGDRVFSDFVISFEYNGLTLKDESKDNYQSGILFETVDDLTPNSDGEVITLSNEEYKAIYEAGEGALNTAKTNATAQIRSHHGDTVATEYKETRDGKQISYLFAPVADIKNLDDKNSIEYAYSFANISQSGTSESITPTVRKDKVYRAFAYLYANGTIIISDPIYFTIYDMASITTGNAYVAPVG